MATQLKDALAATGTIDEIKLIQSSYRKLLRAIKVETDADDKAQIRLAYEVAVRAHRKQRRKSGEPYILHPIEVATICACEIGLGPTAIVAALLHDVVEDTDVTLEEIRNQFGPKVMAIVDGLTKLDGNLAKNSPQAENFRKVVLTLLDDVRVVLIKMADRMHNMRTLGSMPRHKQLKIAGETAYIYAPLAHRLGLYAFKTEFQDLCLKIQDNGAYKDIAKKLHETKRERNRYISDFIRPVKKLVDGLGVNYRIFGRPKSIYSIHQKIENKEVAFEDIFDLFAVRVVIDVPIKDEKQTCWQIYSLITDIYQPIPERLKDWVTTPKSNGYESLHTTVIGPKGRYVEIQIRSERMDDIAERGFAAHWKYKGVGGGANRYEPWLDSIREILDGGSGDASEFLADFKTNLFSEEVFVYTPQGDLVNLPKGATALDFAFSVHSMVGYHCQSLKVNQRLVPMGYELTNGDRVEVITNKNQRPSEGWLKFVVTGKARAKIRSSLKEERRRKGEFGREELERKLSHRKVDFEPAVDAIVKHFKFTSPVDLYYALATDQMSTNDIFREFEIENGKLIPNPVHEPSVKSLTSNSKPKRVRKKTINKPQLLVNGESATQYDFSFATCCNPVQGDDIFGYLSGTNSLKIHRTSCKNAEHLLSNYGYRVLRAEWGIPSDRNFVANLLIKGIDSGLGVIDSLTTVLSKNQSLNIRSMHIDGTGGYFECRISVVVTNIDQLEIAMRALSQLPEVASVLRED
jgi:GTP pyrophosphokinase